MTFREILDCYDESSSKSVEKAGICEKNSIKIEISNMLTNCAKMLGLEHNAEVRITYKQFPNNVDHCFKKDTEN